MKEPDPDRPLRRDVHLLGELLGKTLKEQVGIALYEKVETIRQLSKQASGADHSVNQQLNKMLKSLSGDEILTVVRAFSHFLNCANIAENVHRIRRTRWYKLHRKSSPQPGSLEASFSLFREQHIEPEKIFQAVKQLRIELVLTAHPTEVMRRTLIQKFDHIGQLLLQLDEIILTDEETKHIHDTLYREMISIWQTNEIRRKRPTPIDEAKWGFAIVETSLWQALPQYLRELDEQLLNATGKSLPLLATPIRFSAWMGGDRDGNPNVTAAITREVCLLGRWKAADLYLREITQLSADLSMEKGSRTIHAIVGEVTEPYRVILRHLRKKLHATKRGIEETIVGQTTHHQIIKSKKEILYPLLICYRSLVESGATSIAKGNLTDIIRRVAAFGVSLLPLDIRQEASYHSQLMDEVVRYLELGSYFAWTEQQRQAFLVIQLAEKRPLVPQEIQFSEQSQEVWNTFTMLAGQLSSSLGAYVISMCEKPSDVLLVCLLQKEAHIKHPLRVVPLFETLTDLQNASNCMQQLFAIPWYREFIRHHQEVMIGYSDSGKDAGILAAGYAQYWALVQLAALAQQNGIHLTLFHGRGGTVGRGGGPAHLAILSQPPISFNGSMRVTEQGEVIRNKYGLAQRAQRSLSLYTTANLQGLLLKFPEPTPHWRQVMSTLSYQSYQQYCKIIKGDPTFVNYFQQATPLQEIGTLAIGSRPSRRQSTEQSLMSLRAIPWVFAWTQNRLILPAWLGVYDGLETFIHQHNTALLKEMIAGWPFFSSLLSMIEMVLAKASPEISQLYEKRLVDPALHPLGNGLRHQYAHTVQAMLAVLDEPMLLTNSPLLSRTLRLRAPYLYPLHVLQAELLYRVRHTTQSNEADADKNRDALLVSISGIAAGMQNTG